MIFMFYSKYVEKFRAKSEHLALIYRVILQMLENLLRYQNKIAENTGKTKRRKTSFSKEWVGNADLYKSILNKIMTTRK